jgi:peptidase S41-like protein
MSEKIYSWLLRLFPSDFRQSYGEDALQLFRDRARDETGFIPTVRLWFDLLFDLGISLPREYFHAQPELLSVSAQRAHGTPSFYILGDESPRPGALLFGAVLASCALVTFSGLLSHGGHSRRFRASAQQQRAAHSPSTVRTAPTSPGGEESDSLGSGENAEIAATSQLDATIGAPQQSDQSLPGDPRSNAPVSAVSAARNSDALSRAPALLPQDAFKSTAPENTSRQAEGGAPPATLPPAALDAAERHRIVSAAAAILVKYYVDPVAAQKTADALLSDEKGGDDNSATDGKAFAELLTKQMRDVSHDNYLSMVYSAVKVPPLPPHPPRPSPEELVRYRKVMEQSHCTFESVKILPHNIGYLKFNAFPDPSVCQPTAEAAMASLNGVDAIIFDLRDNGGGYASMVALLAAYLFDQPAHLNDFYNRGDNSTEESWSRPPVPGNKLVDKPAYVLTSSATFSAAEAFSYDLRMLNRVTLVGETTSGRGHMGSPHQIDEHFTIRVPGIKVINPISKGNWEGTGVTPDVIVNPADALQTAEALALTGLHKK